MTKCQNTKQYTISNGKEDQAPQEEEDSLTSKMGEEEAATDSVERPQEKRRQCGNEARKKNS